MPPGMLLTVILHGAHVVDKIMANKKIYWVPSRLIEDKLTGEVYVLMYGGSGRVRYVHTSEVQPPVWDESRFRRKEEDRKNRINQ
jgi:hypothetical protein